MASKRELFEIAKDMVKTMNLTDNGKEYDFSDIKNWTEEGLDAVIKQAIGYIDRTTDLFTKKTEKYIAELGGEPVNESVKETGLLEIEPEVKESKVSPTVSANEFLFALKDLVSEPPFSNIFSTNPKVYEGIKTSMSMNGFDSAFPIVIWGNKVIDGRTRYLVAKELGIEEVPVDIKYFLNEKDAIQYAIHNQRDRRNITDAEILNCIEILTQAEKVVDVDHETGEIKEPPVKERGTKAKRISEQTGVKQTKVKEALAVLKDEKAKKDVKEGKSIHAAAQESKKRKKKTDLMPRVETRIESVVEIMKGYQGKVIDLILISEKANELFIASGHENKLTTSDNTVNIVVEVLVGFKYMHEPVDGKIKVPHFKS